LAAVKPKARPGKGWQSWNTRGSVSNPAASSGLVGAARFIFDDPEGPIFATVGIVGASISFTGMVGLIVSGVRRIHLRGQRDALVAAPLVWRGGPDGAGVGLALSGHF
jgi:hypothetical protein